MNMFVTSVYAVVDVGLRLVPPHEAEMILTNYKREVGEFTPESVKLSWSQLSDGTALWPRAEVSGRRTIKRGARARVEYSDDENGEIRHWPDYVREAWNLARDQVSR